MVGVTKAYLFLLRAARLARPRPWAGVGEVMDRSGTAQPHGGKGYCWKDQSESIVSAQRRYQKAATYVDERLRACEVGNTAVQLRQGIESIAGEEDRCWRIRQLEHEILGHLKVSEEPININLCSKRGRLTVMLAEGQQNWRMNRSGRLLAHRMMTE